MERKKRICRKGSDNKPHRVLILICLWVASCFEIATFCHSNSKLWHRRDPGDQGGFNSATGV